MLKNLVNSWLPPTSPLTKPKGWTTNLRPGKSANHIHASGAPSSALAAAISKAQEALLGFQSPKEGYWCGPLKADTTIASDTIMLLHFLGRGHSVKVRRLANHILNEQLQDGGWPIFRNGPSDISATVKAYWALKFAGHKPEESALERARLRIAALGGIHKANTYTKFYMALFGQYDWRGVPTIPPELMLFPKWFYFNIYAMSSWTRAIVVPLSIVWAFQPLISCPPHAALDELFPDNRRHVPLKEVMPPHGIFSWTSYFLLWDNGLKALEGRGGHWLRVWSLRLAEDWILRRLAESDGLGAIYPGIINTIMAMKCLGYADTDPRLLSQLQILEQLELSDGDHHLEYQPCHSPVWDTAISIIALAESGLPRNHPALVASAKWLISKEIKIEGDWKVGNPKALPGGWAFEFNNSHYPDIDDTAMVMLALRHVDLPEEEALAREKACLRGLNWLLSMRSSTGGWAAFDKNNTKAILTKIPFADHNAMIDPPSADVTARVLEFLGYVGYDTSYPVAAAAVRFLRREQEEDGSWFGRWGVNYIYGTWQVLRGLAAVGENMSAPYVQKAVSWLKSVQQKDGGWGETCATYEYPSHKGRGPSTPSQTAWAVMALMAAGVRDESVERGIRHLIETQSPDGTWNETEFTGTGFPKVFYLEYTMYRQYFPLHALGLYHKALAIKQPSEAPSPAGVEVPA